MNIEYYYEGKTNSTKNTKLIKSELEKLGHTNVHVWWTPIEQILESYGQGGGYMYLSKETETPCPLGFPIDLVLKEIYLESEYI